MVVYKAIFYKVWYCENDKKFVIGSYDDPDATCTSDIKFDDGYYTNEIITNEDGKEEQKIVGELGIESKFEDML